MISTTQASACWRFLTVLRVGSVSWPKPSSCGALLNIPDDYAVMFLGGGASTQFFEVPANLLKKKAAYLQTGVWAKKAAKEAKFYGEVEIVASSEDKNYTYIPKGYKIPTDADYFHITTNNTIYGTEIHEDIDSPITLVADMSSAIMSRPVDMQ